MGAGTIPIKTPDGQAELATRQRRISQRHRTVLFLIDGKRSATEVRELALQAGVPESCFDELLATGLILLIGPTHPLRLDAPWPRADVLHVDLPLPGLHAVGVGVGVGATADSLLPPSRTLYPTLSTDAALGDASVPDIWPPSGAAEPADPADPVVNEAREILLRAVRAEAPLAGSLTLLRLSRARTRDELAALLDEVEARITRPHRPLAAGQTMRRVRHLLASRIGAPLAPA